MAETAVGLADMGDSEDPDNIMIYILPGAGGQEANRFALELARMYESYARLKGWKVQSEQQPKGSSDPIGSGIILRVSWALAGRRLSLETGVHRVQRVPGDERQDRVHTSTATVIVLRPDEQPGAHAHVSEKIRTFSFLDDRVIDHRVRIPVQGIRDVLGGNLDQIIDALLGD